MGDAVHSVQLALRDRMAGSMTEHREPTVIQRAPAKHAGFEPPDPELNPTPPPPVPQREMRQQRQKREPEVEKSPEPSVNKVVPHWALTLADLKTQRELIDTAISAIEALYR